MVAWLLGCAAPIALGQATTVPPSPTPEIEKLIVEAIRNQLGLSEQVPLLESALALAKKRSDRAGEAAALFWLGRARSELKTPELALKCYEQSLAISKELKDARLIAISLAFLGMSYHDLHQYRKSLELSQQALPLFVELKDKDYIAATLYAIGHCYQDHIYQPDQASLHFEQALRIYVELDDKAGVAATWMDLANILGEKGEIEISLSYLNRALEYWRSVGDLQHEALVHICWGTVLRACDRDMDAIQQYRLALDRAKQAQDGVLESRSLNGLGDTYLQLDEYDKALECFGSSLEGFRKARHKDGEVMALRGLADTYRQLDRPSKALELAEQCLRMSVDMSESADYADALHLIGSIHKDLGHLSSAFSYFSQSLELQRKIEMRRGEATSLTSLGGVLQDLGSPEKSFAYYNNALTISLEIKDYRAEATLRNNIGRAFQMSSQPDLALSQFELALKAIEHVSSPGLKATILDNIGSTHIQKSRPELAKRYFEESLKIRLAIGSRKGAAIALNNLGLAEEDLGEFAKAQGYYEQALAGHREAGSPAFEATTLSNLAEMAGKRSRTFSIYLEKLSVNRLQGVRLGALGMEADLRVRLSQTQSRGLRDLAAHLIQEGRLPEAAQALDLLKGQERSEAERAVWSGSMPLTPEEANWETILKGPSGRLEELGKKQQDHRLAREDDQAKAMESQMEEARKEYSETFRLMEERAKGGIGKLASTPTTLRLKVALKDGQAAVYVLHHEDTLYSLVITKGGLKSFSTPAPELNEKILTFRDLLQEPSKDPRLVGKSIYDVLAAPLESYLASNNIKTIYWSLDGKLRLIPVGALWDGARFLVQSRTHAYFPGSDALAQRERKKSEYQILALGASKGGEGYEPLPSVPTEVKAIHDALPTYALLNESFTRKKLEEGLSRRPNVLHIASHFSLRSGSPENSRLLLGDGTTMSLKELESLPEEMFKSLRWVVLSACDTAPGNTDESGYSAEGMSERLLRKGACSIAASLWSVSDGPTAVLMARMYRRLKSDKGIPPLEALRLAQREFITGQTLPMWTGTESRADTKVKPPKSTNAPAWPNELPKFSHPYFWAAFVVTGRGD